MRISGGDAELVFGPAVAQPDEFDAVVGIAIDQVSIRRTRRDPRKDANAVGMARAQLSRQPVSDSWRRAIAANRRNAGQSTGPRSRAGKRRSRRNAYQHGLATSPILSGAVAKQAEKLTRKIAGKSKNPIVLEQARDIACAEIDLARVRRVKVALIERMSALGSLEAAQLFTSAREVWRFLKSIERGESPSLPEREDPLATMPSQEPERTAEAIRRALPELARLDRYESRAAARRDTAVQEMVKKE
jgi:hypothetical protein